MGAHVRCTEPLGTAVANFSGSPPALFSIAFLLIFLGLSD